MENVSPIGNFKGRGADYFVGGLERTDEQLVTATSGNWGIGLAYMAPVSEPFTGAANAIRGVSGGGLPWELDAAKGELRGDGRLEVEVEGLVLARRAPVPEALRGTNPVARSRRSSAA